MLAAIGAYGQNKFKYPVNANGGLRVGGDNHDLIDSVKIVTGTITIYIGGVGYSASVDTTSLSDRINLKLNISDTSDMLDPYIREAEVSSTYSNKALSNLSSVAINTHLLPGTDGGVNLGSATKKFGDVHLDSTKSINWNNGDVTITHAVNKLTMAGGTLDLPSGVHRMGTDTIASKADARAGGGGSMTYPSGSGIPIVVSGTSWGTTITNNSVNWDTAYGWGNHSGLYLPIAGTAASVTGFTPASGSLTLSGANALTLTTTASTNVTLPTTGTLATTAQISAIIHDSLTAVLNNADDGIAVTDTADMLAPYALLSEGLSSGDVAAQINDSIVARLSVAVPGIRVADTASMLSPYALLSEVSGGGITASDTAAMLAHISLI